MKEKFNWNHVQHEVLAEPCPRMPLPATARAETEVDSISIPSLGTADRSLINVETGATISIRRTRSEVKLTIYKILRSLWRRIYSCPMCEAMQSIHPEAKCWDCSNSAWAELSPKSQTIDNHTRAAQWASEAMFMHLEHRA
jgi:hypothetical protein